jgi:hypothetical protein
MGATVNLEAEPSVRILRSSVCCVDDVSLLLAFWAPRD